MDRQARVNAALRLRQSNVSYPRIAEELGCSGSTAASLPDDQRDQQLVAFQAGIAAAEEAASDKVA